MFQSVTTINLFIQVEKYTKISHNFPFKHYILQRNFGLYLHFSPIVHLLWMLAVSFPIPILISISLPSDLYISFISPGYHELLSALLHLTMSLLLSWPFLDISYLLKIRPPTPNKFDSMQKWLEMAVLWAVYLLASR